MAEANAFSFIFQMHGFFDSTSAAMLAPFVKTVMMAHNQTRFIIVLKAHIYKLSLLKSCAAQLLRYR